MTNAQIKYYGDELIEKIMAQSTDALFEGGLMLEADANRRAPRFSGRLKASGYVSSKNRSTYKRRRGYKKEPRPTEEGVVAVGFSAPHSHLVEFGTRKMKAKPYLRPALDALKALLGKKIVTAWGERLKK